MAYGYGRPRKRYVDPRVAEREKEYDEQHARYYKTRAELTAGHTRLDNDEARKKHDLNINNVERERVVSLVTRSGEPSAHLYRIPGVGYAESGLGVTWWVKHVTAKDIL